MGRGSTAEVLRNLCLVAQEIERDPQTAAVDLMTGVQPAWMPK